MILVGFSSASPSISNFFRRGSLAAQLKGEGTTPSPFLCVPSMIDSWEV